MLRIFEQVGDKLLSRIVPNSTASAQTCYFQWAYCVAPSNACPCRACVSHCYICAGHQTCHFTKGCC